MHGNLLVLDDDYDLDDLLEILPEGCDGAMLGAGASTRGCLRLRSGAEGETGIERARREGYPDIVLQHLALLKARVAGGVDRAKKADIENLKELAELVVPAWVILHGDVHEPASGENRESWLARVQGLLEDLDDDEWVGVYDVHR